MLQSNEKVEFISPPNKLVAKTGKGGLDVRLIERLQRQVDAMPLQIRPYMVERISVLIDIVNNDDFANNFNNSTMNDILGEMVAFNIHAKLLKDKAAIDISSSLLRFTERLDTLNIDAFHVIKAHINALKVAFLNKSENLDKDAILGPLMTELLDVCSRYNKKYS